MRLVFVVLVAMTTLAVAAPTARQWKAADKTLRDHLTAQKAEVIDIKRYRAFGPAFWVRSNIAGKPVGKLYVVRGETIFETKSNATVSDILKTDNVLATKKLTAKDLYYLLYELGEGWPAGVKMVIRDAPDRRLNPKLTFGKGSATFVVHSARDVSGPGAPGTPGGPTQLKIYLSRATLTIASDYTLSWKVEPIELPAK